MKTVITPLRFRAPVIFIFIVFSHFPRNIFLKGLVFAFVYQTLNLNWRKAGLVNKNRMEGTSFRFDRSREHFWPNIK